MINENLLLFAVGILNLTNTITNIFYISLSKRMQISKELLAEITEQSKAKDEVIKGLKKDKKEIKSQYDNILIRYKELEGRYKEVNNVDYVAPNQSLIVN